MNKPTTAEQIERRPDLQRQLIEIAREAREIVRECKRRMDDPQPEEADDGRSGVRKYA